MKTSLRRTGKLTLLIWLLSLVAAFASDTVKISSRFSPSTLIVGEIGSFVIEVEDAKSVGNISIPSVDGLRFNATNVHRSVRTNYINGRRSSQMSFMIQVRPNQEGEFTVPRFAIPVDGQEHFVPAATVEVTEAPPPPTHVSRAVPLALQLELVRDKIYVGETLPARIKLYVAADLSASLAPPGIPMKEGDAFAESPFNTEPHQRPVTKDSTSFNEVVWETTVTPLKAGPQMLNFDLNLLVSKPPSDEELFRNRQMFNSPFGSLFGNIMPNYEEKFLTTGKQTIQVEELPTAGKPIDFTGAIGAFTVEQPTLSTLDAQVGDPITLTFKIAGAGNFSRVDPPQLVLPDYWKTYTPKSDYVAKDEMGYLGEKTFEYILVPQAEGTFEIPALQFYFFNPEKGEYVKRSLDIPPIKVRPAATTSATYIAAQPKKQLPVDSAHETQMDHEEPGLQGIQLERGAVKSSIKPVYDSGLFIGMQIFFFVGLLTWVGLRYRALRLDENAPHNQKLKAQRAVQQALKDAQSAADKSDTKGFYEYALLAVRHQLAQFNDDAPMAFTFGEIAVMLSERKVDPSLIDDIKHVFETTDALKFGGHAVEGTSLSDELKRLQEVVRQLDRVK